MVEIDALLISPIQSRSTGLPAWKRGQPGQVGNEAAPTVATSAGGKARQPSQRSTSVPCARQRRVVVVARLAQALRLRLPRLMAACGLGLGQCGGRFLVRVVRAFGRLRPAGRQVHLGLDEDRRRRGLGRVSALALGERRCAGCAKKRYSKQCH